MGNNKKRVAWLAPDFSAGSGGHRTIFANLNYLVKNGYTCDLYINSLNHELPEKIYERIVKSYGALNGNVYDGFDLISDDYDMAIATSWDTAEAAAKANVSRRLYFIQDFEPWFFPMNDDYISAERSYSYGLDGISIGRWLSNKISDEHSTKTTFFNFCADLNVYKPLKNIKKENAICFVFQPDKPRRCHKLALRALQIVQKARPDAKIYFYGSKKQEFHNLKVEDLGIIPIEKCNELYNKCSVGLCMSLSNPSRIPFEMMAAGLPVVELHRENNLYDFPEDGCLLAEPSADAVAAAIIKLLDDKKLREEKSKAGRDFMEKYPLEKGYKQFLEFIENKTVVSSKPLAKIYKKASIKATLETKEILKNLGESVYYHDPTPPPPPPPPKRSLPERMVRKAGRIAKKTGKFIREA